MSSEKVVGPNTPGIWQATGKNVGFFILVCVLPVVGGFLNRIRGGWTPTVLTWLPEVFSHTDTCRRLFFAIPTGILVGILTRKPKLVMLSMIWLYIGAWVGWGCYMSIGHSPGDYASREGVFDWLLNRQLSENWQFWRRWRREIVGMSLRGLLWTYPLGLYFMNTLGGYRTFLFALGGLMMGNVYNIGWLVPFHGDGNFAQGTALSEFLWGFTMWFLVIVSLWNSRHHVAVPFPFGKYVRAFSLGVAALFSGCIAGFGLYVGSSHGHLYSSYGCVLLTAATLFALADMLSRPGQRSTPSLPSLSPAAWWGYQVAFFAWSILIGWRFERDAHGAVIDPSWLVVWFLPVVLGLLVFVLVDICLAHRKKNEFKECDKAVMEEISERDSLKEFPVLQWELFWLRLVEGIVLVMIGVLLVWVVYENHNFTL